MPPFTIIVAGYIYKMNIFKSIIIYVNNIITGN